MNTSKNRAPRGRKVWHELVHNVVDETVGNWTQSRKPDPQVKAALLKFASAVSDKILHGDTPCPDFSPGWKEDISDRVFLLLDYAKFEEAQIPILVAELEHKFGDIAERLQKQSYRYTLLKIANVVGGVTYLEKVGLDPFLLEMTEEESTAGLQRMAMDPGTILFDPAIDTAQDVVNEISLRTNPPDISAYLH